MTSFESVLRVSTKGVLAAPAEVDALVTDLGWELPAGYREYVTTLGRGELCDFLHVRMPEEVREPGSRLAEYLSGFWQPGLLTRQDWDEAIVFATSAERPLYIACRRLAGQLIEMYDDWVQAVPGGFFGLVERIAAQMRHDFPFFDPWSEHRKVRGFDVLPVLRRDGFHKTLVRRWGREGVRRSRTAADETHPNLFVPAIGGRFELFLDDTPARLPPGSLFVRARYDDDSEVEMAAMVDALGLPGGRSWIS
jgi:hypothetical protein